MPHIRSALDYATCLHELGHVNGRYQGSASSKTRERWAWRYARERALVRTAEMEEDAGGELLRELIANWNVPSWDDVVGGLYRPER